MRHGGKGGAVADARLHRSSVSLLHLSIWTFSLNLITVDGSGSSSSGISSSSDTASAEEAQLAGDGGKLICDEPKLTA